MKSSQKHRSISFLGTNQRERTLKALLPENIQIDAREMHEWLAFIAQSAELVQYFNTQNKISGNWAAFLQKDPSVLLALILQARPEKYDNEVRGFVRQFFGAANEKSQAQAFEKLLLKTLDMALEINHWYLQTLQIKYTEQNNPVQEILRKIIQDTLGKELQQLKSLIDLLLQKKAIRLPADTLAKFDPFHDIWDLKNNLKSVEIQLGNSSDWLNAAIPLTRQVFQHLYMTMVHITQKAQMWFEESLKNEYHAPHVGLLLGFLELFKHAKNQLNELPKKHLLHYYQDILQQQPRKHVPDKTVVSFSMAKHLDTHLIEKGVLLSAGSNEKGIPSNYQTLQDLLLSKAEIYALKTLYLSKSNTAFVNSSYRLVSGIYAAPFANSQDGTGTPFQTSDISWPVFGEEQLDKNLIDRRMIDAAIGFIIASPILSIREGKREITLQFQFSESSLDILMDLVDDIALNQSKSRSEVAANIFEDAFHIFVSTELEWWPIKRWRMDEPDQWIVNGGFSIFLYLNEDDPAIASLSVPSYDTHWPMVQIRLNPDCNIYVYSFCAPLEVEAIQIDVAVKGIKSLTLYNQIGLLDGSAPFQLLGPIPQRNAYLLIGHTELFTKRLTHLAFRLQWNNIPDLEKGFAEYYQEYNAGIDNHSFILKLSALSNYAFHPNDAEQQQNLSLFQAEGPDTPLEENTILDQIDLSKLQLKPDYNLIQLPEYSNQIRSGYFKLQLHKPSVGFGHTEFPRLFSTALIAQSQSGGLFGIGGSDKTAPALPREPFVPTAHYIRADYSARTRLNLKPMESGENDLAANEKIFCLHPFGYEELFAQGVSKGHFLFAPFQEDAYLIIGLINVSVNVPISLYFNIKESKQHFINNSLDLQWRYLRKNKWEDITNEHLLSNSTRKFTTSGIVRFMIPADMDNNNTILPPDICWISIAAKGYLPITGRVLDVHIHAVEAEWVDNNDEAHFNDIENLPSIQGLFVKRASIAEVKQVAPFYDGRPDEDMDAFLVRTSEHLRHKNRAITIWDIERLTLEHFPFLRRVKCISNMEYKELDPGTIQVVAIPRVKYFDKEPMLGYHQLQTIEAFLQKRASPFVKINVINPLYDKLKITCSILLDKSVETQKGQYLQILHEDILHFLCPWLKGHQVKGIIQLGGSIIKNDVLAFIKNRPYVNFVTQFSIVQIAEERNGFFDLTDTAIETAEANIIYASKPWAVFTPVLQHNINFITSSKHIPAEASAIQGMRLGTDFIVLESDLNPDDHGLTLLNNPQDSEDPEDEWYLLPDA
jgi:hypothetical protein